MAEAFWEQTPRTHAAVMRGVEQKLERDMELALFTAWQTARMSVFNGGKLRGLADELKKLKPGAQVRKQSPEEIIAAMRAIRATMGGAEPCTTPPAGENSNRSSPS